MLSAVSRITGRRFWWAGLLMLSVALLAWGCAPARKVPIPTAPPAPGTAAYKGLPPSSLEKLGDERLAMGKYLPAADAYQAALKQNPAPPVASRLRLSLAQAYDGAGEQALALEQLRNMPLTGGDPAVLTKGLILQAELERKLGQLNQAAMTLQRLSSEPPQPLNDFEQRQVLNSLAATQSALGRYGQATGTLLELAGLEGYLSSSLQQSLSEAADKASAGELEAQLGKPRAPKLNAILLLALARAQFREGRLDEALGTLSQVDGLVLDQDINQQAQTLRQEISQAKLVNPVAVGVLVPLTGSWAQTGKDVLYAVELGLGLFESAAGKAPVLYIADTKGQPAEAAAQVDQLVDRHRVMAIIGPLGAGSSLAAARQAQVRQVPLISLARIDGLTQSGDYVFQDSLTPQRQVDGLLDEAMNQRNKKRFAVLAPDNSYGRGFAGLFEKSVAARGGVVVRHIYYDPQAKDFTQYVQRLVKLPTGRYRLGLPDSPQPVIDFDGLFIPDGPQPVAMAAGQLRYFDVTGVLLMGTNLWHEESLIKLASRDVQGAILPGCFDPDSKQALVRGFVLDYQEALHRIPTLLEAQGFDAALALRHLIRLKEAPRTRQAMRQALQEVKDIPGVCGAISVDSQRLFEQPVLIYTVDRSAFRLVRPQDRPESELPLGAPGTGTMPEQSPPGLPSSGQ